MAIFDKKSVTRSGRDLIARAIVEQKAIAFTRFAVGDGYLAGEAEDQTDLTHYLFDVPIGKAILNEQTNGAFEVRGNFKAEGSKGNFYHRETGLFARLASDPSDGPDVLFAYTNAGSTADYYSALDSSTWMEVDLIFAVTAGDAMLQYIYNPGAAVTLADLQSTDKAIDDLRADFEAKISSVFRYRGSVESVDKLPTSGAEVGDVYNVEDTGANYAWDGTQWDKLSETIDLTVFVGKKEFEDHVDNNIIHISKDERDRWNNTAEVLGTREDGDSIVYEFTIDQNDSNPFSCVQYPVGSRNYKYAPAGMDYAADVFRYGDWEKAFFMPRPVMLNADGTEAYELDPDDYLKKKNSEDPSEAADTNFNGNAMVAFPQIWLKYKNDGRLMHVFIANKKVDEDYHCYTHCNYKGEYVDYIYLNAYTPSLDSPGVLSNGYALRSLSGRKICANNTFRTGSSGNSYAQGMNFDMSGNLPYNCEYRLIDYGMILMLQAISVLMGRSLDTQAVFGRGRTQTQIATTGEADKKGLFYGTRSSGMLKFFGMENFYGNYWKLINGAYYSKNLGFLYKLTETEIDGSHNKGWPSTYTMNEDMFASGVGFLEGTSGAFLLACVLNPNGIFPKTLGGDTNTNFCDSVWMKTTGLTQAYFGGRGNNMDNGSGMFAIGLDNTMSESLYSTSTAESRALTLACKPYLPKDQQT